jgi:hypothetical protein
VKANGFYRSIQNSWLLRLNKKPLFPAYKHQILGYGKVMRPFHVDYNTQLSKSKIDNIDFKHSEYMYGSANINYTSDILDISDTGNGGNDSGF